MYSHPGEYKASQCMFWSLLFIYWVPAMANMANGHGSSVHAIFFLIVAFIILKKKVPLQFFWIPDTDKHKKYPNSVFLLNLC